MSTSTVNAEAPGDTQSDEVPPDVHGTTRQGGSSAPRRVLALLVVVMLIAAVVLGLVWNHQRQQRDALDQARNNAVTSARQFIVDLDAISVGTVDADLARVQALTTNPFATSFRTSSAALKTAELASKAMSSGTITASGTVSYDQNEATVLVAADRSLRTAADTAGAVEHDRWQVSLEKHGGRWLVSGLDTVA